MQHHARDHDVGRLPTARSLMSNSSDVPTDIDGHPGESFQPKHCALPLKKRLVMPPTTPTARTSGVQGSLERWRMSRGQDMSTKHVQHLPTSPPRRYPAGHPSGDVIKVHTTLRMPSRTTTVIANRPESQGEHSPLPTSTLLATLPIFGVQNMGNTCFLSAILSMTMNHPIGRMLFNIIKDINEDWRHFYGNLEEESVFHGRYVFRPHKTYRKAEAIIKSLYGCNRDGRDSQQDTLDILQHFLGTDLSHANVNFGIQFSTRCFCTTCDYSGVEHGEIVPMSFILYDEIPATITESRTLCPDSKCERCGSQLEQVERYEWRGNYLYFVCVRRDQPNQKITNVQHKLYDSKGVCIADLAGAILYKGNAMSGHYTSVFSPDNERWFFADDSMVVTIDRPTLDRCLPFATVLMYLRTD